MSTIKLGKALTNIIIFQFPEVNVSKKIYANNIPKIFPKDMQKFKKRSPLPRYFKGED
jgi:hypothetical protein